MQTETEKQLLEALKGLLNSGLTANPGDKKAKAIWKAMVAISKAEGRWPII